MLRKKATKRFEASKNKAALLGFDELNVIKENKNLYERLEKDNQSILLELSKLQYEKTNPHGKTEPDLAWLMLILNGYDPITKYVYRNEIERKRDRTTEAINSSTSKVKEYRRGLAYWAQMTAQYADIVTDRATLKAYKDSGTKRVQWHTQRDGHVCEVCKERDKRIYPIDKIPPKPHWGCRCWLTAVEEEK